MSRTLTQNEIALLRPIFGLRINYERVRIVRAFILRKTAVTLGNTVYFPYHHYYSDFACEDDYKKHWFVHEITHVWQHQNGFPVFLSGLFFALRGAYFRRRAYCYQHCCVPDGFADMNMEQQADAVADYFIFGRRELSSVMQPFVQEEKIKPKFWRI